MHYIRFLKPPRFDPSTGQDVISTKITVTTDLGESFLYSDVSLTVELHSDNGTSLHDKSWQQSWVWKGTEGMRSLAVVLPVPALKGAQWRDVNSVILSIRPAREEYAVDDFRNLLKFQGQFDGSEHEGDSGGILAVRSAGIDISNRRNIHQVPSVKLAERLFSSGTILGDSQIHIWEETGESIARHIWDAGVVMAGYLVVLSSSKHAHLDEPLPRLALLENMMHTTGLKILELGAGCGIVSIAAATVLAGSDVLLTDLPEASAILTRNIRAFKHGLRSTKNQTTLSSQVLDWSTDLPSNVASTAWDLVFVADCTYNPDAVSDLVRTLESLAGYNRRVLVALAMKIRHQSEMKIFHLMQEAGFEIAENCTIPLPVLGGEGEEIEIFVFRYAV